MNAAGAHFEEAHTFEGAPLDRSLTRDRTVIGAFRRRVREQGDAPYLTTVSASDEPMTLSYRQMDVLSRRMAGWLRDQGIEPGSTVAFTPVNDATSIATVYAILRTGGRVLLGGPADPPARLAQQMAALGVELLLRPPGDGGGGGIELPDALRLGREPLGSEVDIEPDPLAPALYFGTSGSTAASKLVEQSHYNGAVNADGLRRHHGLRPSDLLLGCLPIHHVNGLHFTVFGPAVAGAHVVLAREFDPFAYPRLVERFRPRIASVVPSILEVLLATWRATERPAGLDYFVSAAAPLTAGTVRSLLVRTGLRVLQGYGLTETTNFSTTMPPDIDASGYQRLMVEGDIPSVGVALPGNEVRVLRPGGSFAEPGEVGEVCMRGHNVMRGYANNPEATAAAFAGGWFHSQDTGYEVIGEDGRRYVVLTGRTKNIAKVRGEAVSLDEMDRLLRAVPSILDAACVAVPHRLTGEQVIAAVVPADQNDPDEEAWRAALGRAFAPHLLPARFVTVAAIPRTATGKVLRPQLSERLTTQPPA